MEFILHHSKMEINEAEKPTTYRPYQRMAQAVF
jgi:hypothetical protein